MEVYRLLIGLVLFMGGLAMMILGVLNLDSNDCTGLSSNCSSLAVTLLLMGIGVILIVGGAVFLSKARFAKMKGPYPRQFSQT